MVGKIKDIYHSDDDFPVLDGKYDTWLKCLLNKTEDEIDENDIHTMFMQHELEELAIKKAIEFIQNDPLAGEMWEGQFLEQLAKEPIDKLKIYKKELTELPAYIDSNVNESMWDFDFEKEEFMVKFNEFKGMLSKL